MVNSRRKLKDHMGFGITKISGCKYAAAEKILQKNGVPHHYYSLGKYAETRACLEYKNGKWLVYEGSRGHKIHMASFDNDLEAFCELFERVTVGKEKLDAMRLEMRDAIAKINLPE